MRLKCKKLLIVGAGEAGGLLLREIQKNPLFKYEIIGFIDDNKKLNKKISGIPVLGKICDILKIVSEKSIEEIIIAIPSLSKLKLKEVINLCEGCGVEIKILPGTYEVMKTWKTGLPWIKPLRKINMEDLLQRKPVLIDFKEIKKYISEKTILITGAGGSIGSELCRQISELSPKVLIVLDNCEYNLYKIDQELRDIYGDEICLKSVIGDVRSKERLEGLFRENKIDIVFHAAAYKHVPLMEANESEAIKNNIFGTYNLASIAEKNNVENFVLISTDKAVNPSSVMGASKRIAEMVCQLFDKKTRFITVRFGNVLGSTGSVIPLFEKQIERGGPITITHPEITRYFMTIPEAAQLVIQAGAIGENKDIMVLDMGEPYKILDIAKELIKLYGLVPEKDIKIKYIGLRPGEKLYEELLTEQEGLKKTKNERIFITQSLSVNKKNLMNKLKEINRALSFGARDILRNKLAEIVPSYKNANSK
ncbi:nucleoside-diphosphate sugar epimerase [Candidatus Pacearchaeota archaeon]|nr:nucleoside-diphosphate sugar epimerase [Candidatus Pacearchaeota archaeon]|tara:strand:- start:14980 stop:16416 length:1437 start_codon:yes stop_codon:yes gene_type:complete